MMRYLLELGHRRFTYAPFLYDVANQRAIADANAQAKARVQYMSKEKVAWLVDTFSSREGLRLLQEPQKGSPCVGTGPYSKRNKREEWVIPSKKRKKNGTK